MAKRNATVPEKEPLDLGILTEAPFTDESLERLYGEMGISGADEANVYIYLVDPKSGDEQRVWKGSPGDYDLDAISKRFGSGQYIVALYAIGGTGRYGVRGKKSFRILLDSAEDARIAAARRGEIPGAPAPVVTEEKLAGMVAQAVAAAMQAARPVVPDPFALIERIAPLFKAMMPTSAPDPLQSLTTVMKLVESVTGMNKGGAGVVNKDGELDVGATALREGITLVREMFTEGMRRQGGVTPAALPPAASGVEQAGVIQLSPEQEADLSMLRMQLVWANTKAQTGADPLAFAEKIYDEIPEEMLITMATDPAWFDVVVANVPECAAYKGWYEKVAGKLVEMAKEDGLLTAPPEPGNVTGHGTGSTIAAATSGAGTADVKP